MPQLRELVEDAVGTCRAPAMGAALVAPDGSAEVAVAGVRARGRGAPVTAADPWHIGSCTKSMTALLYARLVESGAAAWGAPLPDLFPDVPADPGWAAVTIDDVLVHRAGVRPNLSVRAMRDAAADVRPVRVQRTEAAAAVLAAPPDRPGRFRYSNLGYVVAGAAIERVADAPWEDALDAEVLAPLGIHAAGVGAPQGDAPWGHRPLLGARGRGPAMDPARPESADNPAVGGPAGRVHLPLGEWARFVAQFLEGGATLMGEASIARLLARPAGPGPPQAMGWVHAEARVERLLGTPLSVGQQGSNRRWTATALLSRDRRRAALAVANDGRSRALNATALLAARVLRGA
ncbi:MAG TPA: serine hydrolase domain-containing protein [Miltoncostaeaceae bacterium]|nr:serine hydrolase domain-containing protein [Miltoncostaeaceae bacterium]